MFDFLFTEIPLPELAMMDIFSDPVAFLQSVEAPKWEVILSILLGVGLSASCGLRVFIPPLVMSMAALFFNVTVPQEMAWIGTYPAFLIFLTATLFEVGAYYVPWLDNMLDSIAAPAAMVAGTLITSSFIGVQLDPTLKWTIALVAGGGAAGTVQAMTAATRLGASTLTGGLANHIIATGENALAVAVPGVTMFLPIVAVIIGVLVLLTILWVGFKLMKRLQKKPHEQNNTA